MPKYNTYMGDCIYCGLPAYYNEEEDKLFWRYDLIDCLHKLEEDDDKNN